MVGKPPVIVLTGGPCAGKTTGLSRIVQKLGDYSYQVLSVPEVATLFISGGIPIGELSIEQFFEVEKIFLKTQLTLEDSFLSQASILENSKTLLVCDRGAMDIQAYMSSGQFDKLLKDLNLSRVDLRDRRYAGVFHLVTAANGAEEFYALENNQARHETKKEARALDLKTQNAWLGHPHLKVIDNSTDFEGKLRRLIQAICRVVGIPVPIEEERKFLLRRMPDKLPPHERIIIEQAYLPKDETGVRPRIRKRGQNGSWVCFETRKEPTGIPGQRIEVECQITLREYDEMMANRDRVRRIIRKVRNCFIWKNQYFELDNFEEPGHSPILEIELTEENEKVELPDFIEVEKEVTGDDRYGNASIALIC